MPRGGAALALAVGLLAGAGAAAIRTSTPLGVGVGYDAMFYLTSADSLLQGNGLQWVGGGGELHPLVHYPPLYPAVLAALGLFGLDGLHAATWLAAILFGMNIALAGLLASWTTGEAWAGIGVTALLGLSPTLVDVHLEAMSEPLFLLLLLVGLGGLAEYLRSAKRAPLLVAGVAAGLAYLTRYVGLTLMVTGLVLVVLRRDAPARRRLQDVALFAVVALAPVVIWSARNFILTGSVSNRIFNYHPLTLGALRTAADTLTGWIFPKTLGLRVRSVASLVVGAFGLALVLPTLRSMGRSTEGNEHGSKSTAGGMVVTGLVFAALYIVALLISLLFFDASTKLSDRILSPVYLVCLLLLGVVLSRMRHPSRWIAAMIALVLGASYGWRSWAILEDIRAYGRGFNSLSWRNSETIQWIQRTDPAGLIYSNEAFPIQFLTGRAPYWVPERIDSVKGMPRPDYPSQLSLMRSRLRQPDSMLVVFTGSHYRVELPPIEELTAGLVQVAETSDGKIYADPASGPGRVVP